MKSLIAGALLATAFFTVPALAQSMGERSGINSALGVTPKTEDFVKEVAVSDMFEIESSKLAARNAQAAPIKAFADQMVTDHTKTSGELKSMVSSGTAKIELPTAMDSAHQSKLDKLKSLKGADFDKQYVADQRSAHKDAVSLFERYSKGGDHPELKVWAGKTLPALRHHLEMADQLPK